MTYPDLNIFCFLFDFFVSMKHRDDNYHNVEKVLETVLKIPILLDVLKFYAYEGAGLVVAGKLFRTVAAK